MKKKRTNKKNMSTLQIQCDEMEMMLYEIESF